MRFAGRVSDAEAVDLYAGARAVYYAPVDEDYGFATIEAFASAKPVITTTDAGGVLEFVEHDVTGLVAAPDACRPGRRPRRPRRRPRPGRPPGRRRSRPRAGHHLGPCGGYVVGLGVRGWGLD